MNKKPSTSKKVPIRKRKNLFIGVGMRVDFTKEDYKKYGNKILKNYSKINKWNLKKEKMEEGYSVMINSKSGLSAEDTLNFIEKINSMLKDIQKELKDGQLVYPDEYTTIKNYENLLLGIFRFSDMMVINITPKNAITLHNEDPEIASKIFGDYGCDGKKLLNLRVVNDNVGKRIFSKIKNSFGKK